MAKNSPRCIVCEEAQLARVDDAVPSQILPVPRSAVAGFPEGRDSGNLTRRRLMQAGLAGFASVYAPKILGFEEMWGAAAAQASPGADKCLVVIYLGGGNDGLNLMLPSATFSSGAGVGNDYKNYKQNRPTIYRRLPGDAAAGAGGVVGSYALPGTDMLLANPMVSGTAADQTGVANRGFDKLWGPSGLPDDPLSTLALMPAVDYRPPNLSHFDSADHWFYGSLDKQPVGWLGSFIDHYGDALNPLQAVSIDNSLSKLIRTKTNPVCAIPDLSSLGFDVDPGYGSPGGNPGSLSQIKLNDEVKALAMASTGAGNAYLARTRNSYGVAVDTYNRGRNAPHATSPAAYPADSYLAEQLRLASILLGANLGTRIVTIHWGGFDTHSDQKQYQDPQMRELSLCLQAFKDDLTGRGVEDKVATMCFSEFGRRMEETDSKGTDHGAGGLMILSGSQVRGGQATEFPGCVTGALLDGNLRPATDFRSVYQSVLTDWLGGDPAVVLPDYPAGGFDPLISRGPGAGSPSLFR